MNEIGKTKHEKESNVFSQQIENKVIRKMKAQRETKRTLGFGFSMMGLVGWSVVVPTLLGVIVGIFLDRHFSGTYSWTLLSLTAGVIIGCFNAWYWVSKEGKKICKEEENPRE